MLAFEDYVAADGVTWATRIRAGEVSAAEVTEAAIARAEAVNPAINAVASPLYEAARARAQASFTGPLGGVPFALKELYQTMPGVPVRNGGRAWADVVGTEDSELVKRHRAAGLNIICTSTTPELATSATTESTLFGATRNPWDLDRTSGGSSGGASALVAAGVLPIAHATDGGGSIRGPAACCGLFGLKPSRGAVPIGPGRTEGWGGCSTTHAVSRSVRDSAVLLDATFGPEPGSRYFAKPPRTTYADAVEREPGRLRIAYHHRVGSDMCDITVDSACLIALEEAATLCESLGHNVELAEPRIDPSHAGLAFGVTVVSAVGNATAARARALGVESIADQLEQTNREYAEMAPRFTGIDLLRANDFFMEAALAMARFHERYDLILTPTMGSPPVPIGYAHLMQPADAYARATIPFSCFTAIYNMTGQPAMTVPLHWTADGLPVGVQFAAKVGGEEVLFSLAAQLERAQPWFDRRPPL